MAQENVLKEHFMQYVYGPISIQFQAKLEENQSMEMQNLCDGAGGHASFLAIEKAILKRGKFPFFKVQLGSKFRQIW